MSMMRKLMSKNRKGFTLIELIVVLAILGVILAIAVPRYNGLQEAAQEKADRSAAALIIKSARLMQANENITDEADAIDGMDNADTTAHTLDVSTNGIATGTGAMTYYEADSVPQSDGTAFTLGVSGELFTVTYGGTTFTEGDAVN